MRCSRRRVSSAPDSLHWRPRLVRRGFAHLGALLPFAALLLFACNEEPPPASLITAPPPAAATRAATEADTRIQAVDSPFVTGGKALRIQAPESDFGRVYWRASGLEPGHEYTLSFFHCLETGASATVRPLAESYVYVLGPPSESPTVRMAEQCYSAPHPRFFCTTFRATEPECEVLLRLSPGTQLIVGHVGETVSIDRLIHVREASSSRHRGPGLTLPPVYRGLRSVEIGVFTEPSPLDPELTRVERVVSAFDMNVATALLPRVLPGENTLVARSDSTGPGARLQLSWTPRATPSDARFRLYAQPSGPADGVNFLRVFAEALDADGRAIPGVNFRLAAPQEVHAQPYVVALAASPVDQSRAQFHCTSTTPGVYELPLEFWTEDGWRPAGQSAKVEFTAARPFALPISELPRVMLEPRAGEPATEPGPDPDKIHIALSGPATDATFYVSSDRTPQFDWQLQGPVERLGLARRGQPTARDIPELGSELRSAAGVESQAGEVRLVADIEAYVSLLMGLTNDLAYGGRASLRPGLTLRKGWGWCAQNASTASAIAIAAGLQARRVRTSEHSLCEVRGQWLGPIACDPHLELPIVNPAGERIGLHTYTDPDVLFVGRCAEGRNRLGMPVDAVLEDYFALIDHQPPEWWDQENLPPEISESFRDADLFCVTLKANESLRWSSGCFDDSQHGAQFHQTRVTFEAVFEPAGPANRFICRLPVEVDAGYVRVDGAPGPGGSLSVTLSPHLGSPLIAPGVEPYVR